MLPVALFAAGAGLNLVGGLMRGARAARIARQNAAIYNAQAQSEIEAAKLNAQRLETARQKGISAARTGFLASGVAAGGTSFDVLNELTSIKNQDVAQTQIEGFNKAAYYRQSALNALGEAKGFQQSAFSDSMTSILGAGINFASGSMSPTTPPTSSGAGWIPENA